ncbi:MAG TPA: hypothetical protein DCP02_01930 [Actinobacteria bacterium]|nr:hypothetical protein [Actinomycetota bacterium]
MGGFLDSLKNFFTMTADSDSKFIIFKIICDRCGEEISVKASKTSDISQVYDEEGPSGATHFLRKEILGNNCNNLIYITVYFGQNYIIISKEVTGGKFVD